MGPEQLSGFEGQSPLAQDHARSAMAPGRPYWSANAKLSPCPEPSLKTSMAPGIGSPVLDRTPLIIKEECRCDHARIGAVGTPTHPRLEAHTNDLIKRIGAKNGLAAMRSKC